MPTDVELKNQAVVKIKQITTGWLKSNGQPRYPDGPPPTTFWAQSLTLLDQISSANDAPRDAAIANMKKTTRGYTPAGKYWKLALAELEKVKDPVAPSPWTHVANEGEEFTLTEPHEVRYGKGSAWTSKVLNAGTHACSNIVFGDPAPNVYKECQVSSSVAPPPDPDPTPEPPTGAYKLEHFSDFKNNSFPPYIFYNRWSQGTNNYTGPGDVKPAWPSISPEPAIQEISTPHGPGFRIRCNPEMVQPAGGKIVNIEDFDHLVPDNDLIGQTQEWTFMWMFPAAGNPQQFPRNWSDSNTIFEFHDTWHPLLIGIDTTGTKQHLYVTSSAMTNGSYPRKRGEAPDPIQFDRWYHMRFQIKFSHDTSGFVKAWHDNVQIADLHGQSVVSSASGAYVILGFYSMGIEKRNEIHYAQVTQRLL